MSQTFWAPEYDVSADEARALIAAQFPHVSPCVIERFGAGMDNIAFLVDRKYVFRFPRRSIIVPLLETETAVLPLIAPHVPIPVPVPRFKGVPQGYISVDVCRLRAAAGNNRLQRCVNRRCAARACACARLDHSALVADYGIKIEDADLRDAGITALERIREAIARVF